MVARGARRPTDLVLCGCMSIAGPYCSAPSTGFGKRITSRRREGLDRLGHCLFALGFFIASGAACWYGVVALRAGNTSNAWGCGLGLVLTLIFACFFCRELILAYDFYESGVVWKGLRGRHEFAYANAESLEMHVIRMMQAGVHFGTKVLVQARGSGKSFEFRGRHRERYVREGLMAGRFEGDDAELDLVRDCISGYVANKMKQQRQSDGQIDWCKKALLSNDGLTPSGGRLKGEVVEWRTIRTDVRNGFFQIYVGGDPKPAVEIPCFAKNFYPGLDVAAGLAEDEDCSEPFDYFQSEVAAVSKPVFTG